MSESQSDPEKQSEGKVTRRQALGTGAAVAGGVALGGLMRSGDAAASSGTAAPVYRYTDYRPDIKGLRIPGVSKSFDQLTISELVQLRPTDMNSTYEINAVTDNVSITTSALLNELSHIRSNAALRSKLPTLGSQEGVSVKIHKTTQ